MANGAHTPCSPVGHDRFSRGMTGCSRQSNRSVAGCPLCVGLRRYREDRHEYGKTVHLFPSIFCLRGVNLPTVRESGTSIGVALSMAFRLVV
jgi:hypothetical protein